MQRTVEGIDVAYDDEGRGPALLFIHGHPFDRSMWRSQIDHFRRRWRVIAPDLRGYGASAVVPGTTPLSAFAGDIAGLCDELGAGRVVVAGLSMGGQIAMEFYRRFPDRVRGLALADTSAMAETEEGARERRAMADRLVREGMAGYAEAVLPKMVAPRNIRASPEVADHVLRMMRATHPEGAAAAMRGRVERPDYRDLLARATVPVLIVVGSEDEFTPVADARVLHASIPGADLAVIDGAAHMPNLERPAEFNRALERLLERVEPEPIGATS
jgi:pimeloyl-ACP methyl ester carboxylesterase